MNAGLSPEQPSDESGSLNKQTPGHFFSMKIGDMPPTLQTKLLRVLEEREFQRIGGTSTISINIRVLTATHQDLADAVEKGNFRLDLYHRLAAFHIGIPPLRERREDIPILAHHFMEKSAAAAEKPIRAISADALHVLTQHDFPGNVRELKKRH